MASKLIFLRIFLFCNRMEIKILKLTSKIHTALVLLLYLVVSQLAFGQDVSDGNPFSETFSIHEYDAGPSNRSITQNDQGLLFFGNNFGLIKYDGVYWEALTLSVKEGVAANSVFYDKGKVYAGSQREFGYFESNSIGQYVYVSLSSRLNEDQKNSFREVWKIWKINERIVFYSYVNLFHLLPHLTTKSILLIITQPYFRLTGKNSKRK